MNVNRIATLKAHNGPLYALAPGRTSGSLFSGGGDRIVAEWDIAQRITNPFSVRTDRSIYSLLNVRKEQLVIGTSRGSIHVVDMKTRKEVRHLKLHDESIFHLAHHPSTGRAYACCADGTVSVWDDQQWSLLWHLQIGQGKVRRIAFDDERQHIAVSCGDGNVHILYGEDHTLRYTIEAHEDSCNSLAFLPNGNLISGGKDAHLKVWDAQNSFLLLHSIPAHNFAIYDIVVDPNGQWIATASRDKTIKLWDIDLLEKPVRIDRANYDGHINSVNRLLYLEDEEILASCSDDRTVSLWRIES